MPWQRRFERFRALVIFKQEIDLKTYFSNLPLIVNAEFLDDAATDAVKSNSSFVVEGNLAEAELVFH